MTTKTKPAPTQEVKPEFVFPTLALMTPVEVTTSLNWSDCRAGLVIKVSNRMADVLMFQGGYGGGMTHLRDCVHADDPWCEERPAMFEDDDRGIFRLADSEKLMRLIFGQHQGVNASLEELMARVAKLETHLTERPADSKSKRPAQQK